VLRLRLLLLRALPLATVRAAAAGLGFDGESLRVAVRFLHAPTSDTSSTHRVLEESAWRSVLGGGGGSLGIDALLCVT
jgi:hypothetical protein